MAERDVIVDHTTVQRWAVKRPVGLSWRMEETCVKVAGQ